MTPGRPLIGVTTYPRSGQDRPAFFLPTAYVDSVRRAGGLPLLLAPGDERPEDVLDHVDGIVFSGGGDLDPSYFEADPHPTQYGVDDERDRFELALMRGALERETPILAICRGLQVLNVVQGGDLHVHLPDVYGEAVLHRHPERRPIEHSVRLDPGSHLAKIYGSTELRTISWHHQAVNRLGAGLAASAWAPDGTIEAVEVAGRPWVLAVQWHPEMQPEDPRLFAAFVRAAGARRG